MRRFLLTTVAATAVMLGGCIVITDGYSTHSDDGDTVRYVGGELNRQLDTDGDARLSGSDVSVTGRAGGTVWVTSADFEAYDLRAGAVHASAADIEFDGSVERDVDLQGADVRWQGPVGGRFDVSAADLVFEGVVGERLSASIADARLSGEFGSLDLRGADIYLAEDVWVVGDVDAAAAVLRHEGRIEGDLDLSAKTAFLNGDVSGQVDLKVDPGQRPWRRNDGRVEINGTLAGGEICARHVVISGDVTGPLSVMADERPEFQGGSASEIQFTPRNGERCDRGWEG